MSLDFILENEPCEFWIYDDAYLIRIRQEDQRDYRVGLYTYEAFSRVLANAFKEKGADSIGWMEEPLLTEHKPLTEEEKERQIKQLFSNLFEMQAKFENRENG